MPSIRAPWSALLAVIAWWSIAAAEAAAADLEPFFGAYVGVAEVADLRTGETQQRDLDIVIEPYRDGGFRVHWVNVTLVEGRRDRPGVERRIQTVLFEPSPSHDFFVEVEAENPFREREATRPMRGDPVRWAVVEGNSLQVRSFVVLEDGRYELQTYHRTLTEIGMDIHFQRFLDGQLVREILGSTARANVEAPG